MYLIANTLRLVGSLLYVHNLLISPGTAKIINGLAELLNPGRRKSELHLLKWKTFSFAPDTLNLSARHFNFLAFFFFFFFWGGASWATIPDLLQA